ncbi:AraC family transcriptional regulator [Brevundimonas sp. 2R-24]|uniref:AraC family transcriptional regulator n=1 Tax=Peiella sedimenti TaxID=3061083 RepID=A0ABT8SHX9_9CAUL|nr:AraC family transcriptional regulator [Caulobacteraceae bacterium XZ-24]
MTDPGAMILVAVYLAAVMNGALVALALLFQERFGPARSRLTLAALLMLTSALLGLFVVLDTGAARYTDALGMVMDAGALLISGLLIDYVATSVGISRGRTWAYAPVTAYSAAALINGGRFGEPEEIGHIIVTQAGMTAAAIALWLLKSRAAPPALAARSENLHLPVMLAGVTSLHVAQLARLAAPESSLLYEMVPLIGAGGLLTIAGYAVCGSQTLRAMVRAGPAAEAAPQAQEVIQRLWDSRAFLDPDLSLPKAASLLGLKAYQLSRLLNGAGLPFRQVVNQLRVREAQRLLTSPAEARTSMDAIGGLSGFRSRSRFYAAFQQETGQSPVAWRERQARPITGKSVPSRKAGQQSG